MPNVDDILWFKKQFHTEIDRAVRGTPCPVDLLVAIACQETGYIWSTLRKKGLGIARILELCVGDTLDARSGRKAFPRTKGDLLAKPNGAPMFAIARAALVDMAKYIPGYQSAAKNPSKFCHGFGIFQYDLQFFPKDPNYFLQKQYADFDSSLRKCIEELQHALHRVGWQARHALTDYEAASVGIAYNTGRFVPSKGLKQGFHDGSRYYGEAILDYLRLSKTVAVPPARTALLATAVPGTAIIPPPSGIDATGPLYKVDVRVSLLRLRRLPEIDANQANVIAHLPDGHLVRAITGKKVHGFLEVETSLLGAHFRGFAAARYLKPTAARTLAIVQPAADLPRRGIVPVYMPRARGTVTRRTAPAGAHSLNEAHQPGRQGATPDALRADLTAIIEWLAVDKPSHRRYQPVRGSTFCNIYVHDYCYLAGVYLPRVWWTAGAIELLAQGIKVDPQYGKTIEEQRANDLFRWLRDFGPRFGWRQTGTLSKLQLEANQGAVCLIVARRKEDGKSGHIVAVVPETEQARAKRNADGDVVLPLQSQAGVTNFRFGTGKGEWWKGSQFADSAFWLHA